MSTATADLTLAQGATYSQTFDWQEADGSPIDVTGWTVAAQLRPGTADEHPGAPSATFTVALGGTAGTITLTLTAEQAAAIPAGDYRYDVLGTDTAGRTWLVVSGAMTVTGQVTR